MREVCKSGAVVAAVVAVLEKQSRQFTPAQKPPPIPPRNQDNSPNISREIPSNSSAQNSNEPRKPEHTANIINTNKSDLKNRNTQDSAADENNFELAVQDFNTVAEDVEKTFCDDALAKNGSNLPIISECFTNSSIIDPSKLFGSHKLKSGVDANLQRGGEERVIVNGSASEVRRKNCVTIDFKSDEGGYRSDGERNKTEIQNGIIG